MHSQDQYLQPPTTTTLSLVKNSAPMINKSGCGTTIFLKRNIKKISLY